MSTLLKVLHPDGRAFRGGTGSWHLPQGKRPGKWMPKIKPIPDKQGYHVCTVSQALDWFGPAIFEVEVRGEKVDDGDKLVVEQARLVRRLPWDARTARLFAADCAEHVLHLFEREHPDDLRPRQAIEMARRFAIGEVSEWERPAVAAAALAAEDAAQAAARAAARSAAWSAAWAAWAAARAAWVAAWDAARAAAGPAAGAAERDWQAQRLADLLGVER